MVNRVHNFNAGPAALPLEVLESAKENLLNYEGTGLSVMEMSHRSAEYSAIHDQALADVKEVLGVPDDYSILFLQGGASTQFAMVPMNLASADKTVDIIQTGSWTKKATKEIKKLAKANIAATTEKQNFLALPKDSDLKLTDCAAYVHMASNNTIFGTQAKRFYKTKAPLVCDMSSDIASRKISVNDFGLIFAGAQKNLGPSGVTLVIIKKDLADRAPESLPSMFQYRTHIDGNSLYNTPPTFGIYLLGLTMKHIKKQGGLNAIAKINQDKADLLYKTIDESNFYKCPVAPEDRSVMNVVFRIHLGGTEANEDLEKKFVAEAKEASLIGLKGHRSVGGLRASIYNAMTMSGIEALIEFMRSFQKNN